MSHTKKPKPEPPCDPPTNPPATPDGGGGPIIPPDPPN